MICQAHRECIGFVIQGSILNCKGDKGQGHVKIIQGVSLVILVLVCPNINQIQINDN